MVLIEENQKAKEIAELAAATFAQNYQPLVGSGDGRSSKTAKGPSKMHRSIQFIDKVVLQASDKFSFRVYDTKNCWYKLIVDCFELRSYISQSIRETRKEIAKLNKQTTKAAAATQTNTIESQQHQQRRRRLSNRSIDDDDNDNSNVATANDGRNNNQASVMGVDPRKYKRFKKDENDYGEDNNPGCF